MLFSSNVLTSTQYEFFYRAQRWTVNKQMKFEGGFQGRTNKLVDGCYSFWCGAIMPIVQAIMSKKGKIYEENLQFSTKFLTNLLQQNRI